MSSSPTHVCTYAYVYMKSHNTGGKLFSLFPPELLANNEGQIKEESKYRCINAYASGIHGRCPGAAPATMASSTKGKRKRWSGGEASLERLSGKAAETSLGWCADLRPLPSPAIEVSRCLESSPTAERETPFHVETPSYRQLPLTRGQALT